MFVAVYHTNQNIRIEEIPKPKSGPDEILVKVMACGICGSDVMEWYRIPKAPRVLGHEATGTIVEIGEKVTPFKVGDRVFVSHHVPCNKCRYCLKGVHTACETLHKTNFYPGGFSQYIRVPKKNVECGVYRLPPNMSFEEGTFIEPLGCVVRGQRLIAPIWEDDPVLILGSGVSGILHIQLAKLRGAQNIVATDINSDRLKFAEKFGAHYTINAKEDVQKKLKEITRGKKAAQVIVSTGAPQAALTAFKCVDRGGTILFFAVPQPSEKIPVSITQFWRNEITIKTSYGAAPKDLSESLKMLTQKRINVIDMITHKLPLKEISEGFRVVSEAGKSLKVIIEPNNF